MSGTESASGSSSGGGNPSLRARSLLAGFLKENPGADASRVRAFAARHPEDEAALVELFREILDLSELVELPADAIAEHLLRDGRIEDLASLGHADPPPDSGAVRGLATDDSPPRPMDTAVRYRDEGEVARGGMGAIRKVWDRDLHRHLAMKVALEGRVGAPPGSPADPGATALARFIEEARIAAQLDHPGVVTVHELGLDGDGRVYYTMPLLRGRDLGAVFELVEKGAEGWTRTRALGALLKVCEAVAYAHSKGVVHRDLKPSNVIVGRFGEVVVVDWGLARILGRADTKNVTIAPEERTAKLHSLRRARGDADPDSPLLTMDGDVVGTPAYMPPEQALGRGEQIGPHSDVYAVGAMLYRLYAGHMPYLEPGMRLSNYAIWYQVQKGPPTPLSERAPDTPPELTAICERAMARDIRDRYPDMGALALDLSAFLEHRVVAAYETGALAEARKWVRRNRPFAAALAAAVLLLVVGLGGALGLNAHASENARLADRRLDDVLSLSASVDLEALMKRAEALWPPHPELIPRYEGWLAEAGEFLDGRPADPERAVKRRRSLEEWERRLADLRARSLPPTEEQARADLEGHPHFQELTESKARLLWYSRMLGDEPWPSEAETAARVAEEGLSDDPDELNSQAMILAGMEEQRYGEEAFAVALARRALELVADSHRAHARDTLAWALFRNGRLDEALEEEALAIVEFPDPDNRLVLESATRLEAEVQRWSGVAIAARQAERDSIAAEVAALDDSTSERRTYAFADEEDAWWHGQLSRLVGELHALSEPSTGWGIAQRLAAARELEEDFGPGGRHAQAWERDLPAIRAAYPDTRIELQLGLVPIGPDPASGLWEFAHLLSGEPAVRKPNGRLEIREETGIVLVLLRAGRFFMGAQALDPAVENWDPEAQPDERPAHVVSVSPFFLSKYEMTQAQWLRFVGSNPSYYRPSAGSEVSLVHPVEQVSWLDCERTMRELGLALPTEAQWEYGARAGSRTPWWTGEEPSSLRGAANLADQAAKRAGAGWLSSDAWPDLDDEYAAHAPVDRFLPNAFGLHNVHGNVYEWCLDGYAEYVWRPTTFDPVVAPASSETRVSRGGSFTNPPTFARASRRIDDPPANAEDNLGLRPARPLLPSGAGFRSQ